MADLSTWIIAAVAAIIVTLGVAYVVVSRMRHRRERRRGEAEALRAEAAIGSTHAAEARRVAEEARVEAERRASEAKRAKHRADETEERALAEEAEVEDRVREADRLDPEVDHRAGGYTPEAPPAGPAPSEAIGHTEAGTLPPDEPGAHRG